MFTARLVICLTVLASSLGFAQTSEESPPAPEASPSPPPLVSAPEQAEPIPPPGESIPYPYRPSTQQPPLAKRILLEMLAGSGTGIVSGFTGFFTSTLLVETNCSELGCALPVLGTMGLGVVVGTPLGVYGIGRAMGGQGKYWASLVGTAVGSLAGFTLAAVTASASLDTLTIISLVTGPIAGAIVGYELSNSDTRPAPPPPVRVASSALPGFQCVPMFSVSPSGGILGGLAGRF